MRLTSPLASRQRAMTVLLPSVHAETASVPISVRGTLDLKSLTFLKASTSKLSCHKAVDISKPKRTPPLIVAKVSLNPSSVVSDVAVLGPDTDARPPRGADVIPAAADGSVGAPLSPGEDWSPFTDDSPEGSFFSQAPSGTQTAPPQARGATLGLPQLADIPDRYWTVLKASLAFILANMDKVNLSVAIIPMAHQYSWSASTAGLVQSSFFWGYALSLVPAGWMATRFTGQRVLRAGVVMWSAATALVPLCAGSLPLLLLSRGLVGFGEGVAPPAATDLVARLMPASERTRAVSTVFNGFNVGSVLGLLIAPLLIEHFGWQSVFYFFGLAGVLWSVGFNPPPVQNNLYDSQEEDTLPKSTTLNSTEVHKSHLGCKAMAEEVILGREDLVQLSSSFSAQKSVRVPREGRSGPSHEVQDSEDEHRVPWRAILQRRAVWALVYIHFCQNWGHFCVLAWLPTFYNDGLHLSLSQSALVSMVPPILSILISAFAAPLADRLVQRGTDVTLVRKIMQGTAFAVPMLCMIIVAYASDLGLSQWAIIALLSVGLGFSSCAYAGLYCAHQDMSKKYASILLGLSTTVGAIPGIIGVPLTGVLFDATQSWVSSLFFPSILFYVSGTLVWSLYADCRPQQFEKELPTS